MFVVVSAWEIPDRRVSDFVSWNEAAFAETDTHCVIVRDSARQNIESQYVTQIVYPGDLEIFSLSKTSNYGIRLCGSGVICKTDIDCIINSELLKCMAALVPGRALCPIYKMATCADDPNPQRWAASRGTFAAHYDDWAAVTGYDERMSGYGIEDGDLFARMEKAGVKISRGAYVMHVAHDAAATQRGARGDLWNSEGVNPRRHSENKAICRSGKWKNQGWGTI